MPKSIKEILERLFNDGISFDRSPYGREKYLIESLSAISDWLESKKKDMGDGIENETAYINCGWNGCIDELKKEIEK